MTTPMNQVHRVLIRCLAILALGSVCVPALATPGACCVETSSGGLACVEVEGEKCDDLGGYYYGDGTSCGDDFVECAEPGDTAACCVEDSDLGWYCIDATEPECLDHAGVWYGIGVDCGDPGVNCYPLDETGACCYEDPALGLVCVELTLADCHALSGYWYGAGTICSDPFVECDPAPETGACCYEDPDIGLVCIEVSQTDCEALPSSIFYGVGSVCTDPFVECEEHDWCVDFPGSDCAGRPHYTDNLYTTFGPGRVAVETASPNIFGDQVVTVFDLTGIGMMPLDTNLSLPRYSHVSWTENNLGSILGLAMDEQGNIFVTTTRTWNADVMGPAGWGAIYRIDHVTSAISVFAVLPNITSGLGSITYDCDHEQFFVTNFEDGLIYRLDYYTGAVLDTYDHGAAWNGNPGPAVLGDRPFAVEVNGDRLYYSLWNEDRVNKSSTSSNEIWSIELDTSGAFVAGTDRLEITLPGFDAYDNNFWSSPVSDIDFSPTGSMLLAERSQEGFDWLGAHYARVLEYICDGAAWVPSGAVFAAGSSPPSAAGGVDAKTSRVWASVDAMHMGTGDNIYGFQGLPAVGGAVVDSWLVDYNDNLIIQDKTMLGDLVVTRRKDTPDPPEVECPVIQVLDVDCLSVFGPHDFEIRFGFDNMDPSSTITGITLTPPSGTTLTPDSFALALPPLHGWPITSVLEGALQGTTVCIDVEIQFDTGATCFETICIDLPECIIWVPGDFNYDSVVDVTDLISLLDHWGETCDGADDDCDGYDPDDSGEVDLGDLLIVLANWGS